MKWTAEDERALDQLARRKAQVMEQHRAKLADVLSKVAAPKLSEEERLAAAVQWADDLRDALLPFDSGARAAK